MTPGATTLAAKVRAIDEALASVPHAFGGAIALAYYAEPRATIDIDLNVFVAVEQVDQVTGPLSRLGVAVPADVPERVLQSGQTRLRWDHTPIDLFFAYDAFHDAARRGARTVPFADTTIPVLGVEHLVVCKAVFDRPKDWVDISAVLANGVRPDPAECLRWLGRTVGDTDPRYDRLATVLVNPG